MNEEWRDIPRWEGFYQASSTGKIRSVDRSVTGVDGCTYRYGGRELAPSKNLKGYKQVMLCRDCGGTGYKVHKLVLITFDRDRPDGYECRHLDGDKTNNNISNLTWGTPTENVADSIKHGDMARGERSGASRLTERDVVKIRELGKSGETQRRLATMFRVHHSTIHQIISRSTWTHVP